MTPLSRRASRWTLKDEKTAAEFATAYGVHPTMIHQWKKALLEGAQDIFERGGKKTAEIDESAVRDLHAICGRPHGKHYFRFERLGRLRSYVRPVVAEHKRTHPTGAAGNLRHRRFGDQAATVAAIWRSAS
jgi:hypothetical protein